MSSGAPPVIAINVSLARALLRIGDPIGRRLTGSRWTDGQSKSSASSATFESFRCESHRGLGSTRRTRSSRGSGTRRATWSSGRTPTPRLLRHQSHGASRTRARYSSRSRPAHGRRRRRRTGASGFYAAAVASFALTAVLLAGFGIYGTVTSAVAERRRELGVRLALGASHGSVLMRAASCGLTPTLLGLAAGVPLALAAGRIVASSCTASVHTTGRRFSRRRFHGPRRPGGCARAAVRATRIDPVLVLKHEAGG